jgi:hypothetical protein
MVQTVVAARSGSANRSGETRVLPDDLGEGPGLSLEATFMDG